MTRSGRRSTHPVCDVLDKGTMEAARREMRDGGDIEAGQGQSE